MAEKENYPGEKETGNEIDREGGDEKGKKNDSD